MGITPRAGLWGISNDQTHAIRGAKGMMAEANAQGGPVKLDVMDDFVKRDFVIYVYNILQRDYIINQPPAFPAFYVEACEKNKRFSVTILPPVVLERYSRLGTNEYFYKYIDGRKYATSLLNPAAFPGTAWEAQLQNWKSIDQFGNNLNALGVFWSLEPPDSPELEKQLKMFQDRVMQTMNHLAAQGGAFYAANQAQLITPLMHFAMDYLHRQAPWHMSQRHMIECPNCGEAVIEGIIYHKNSMGDRCILDPERYKQVVEAGKIQAAAMTAAEEAQTQMPQRAPAVALDEESQLEAAAKARAAKTAPRNRK